MRFQVGDCVQFTHPATGITIAGVVVTAPTREHMPYKVHSIGGHTYNVPDSVLRSADAPPDSANLLARGQAQVALYESQRKVEDARRRARRATSVYLYPVGTEVSATVSTYGTFTTRVVGHSPTGWVVVTNPLAAQVDSLRQAGLTFTGSIPPTLSVDPIHVRKLAPTG